MNVNLKEKQLTLGMEKIECIYAHIYKGFNQQREEEGRETHINNITKYLSSFFFFFHR